jgi:hypothetical protein
MSKRIQNKWEGYYLEDCTCDLCLYYISKKRGCLLEKCCCAEEKYEAAEKGRIKRERGIKRWDM